MQEEEPIFPTQMLRVELDNIVFNESNIGTLNWNNGNLNVPPFFVDTENNDFHLLASSKLINAGHPDSSDSDGTRSDIGAYFYYNTYSVQFGMLPLMGIISMVLGAMNQSLPLFKPQLTLQIMVIAFL